MKRFVRSQLYIASAVAVVLLVGISILFLVSLNNVKKNSKTNLLLGRDKTATEMTLFFNQFKIIIIDIESHMIYEDDISDDHLLEHFIYSDETYDSISSIYFYKKDGIYLNSGGYIPTIDLKERIWYEMAYSSNEIIFTPAYLNASKDKLIITVAKRIEKEDEFLGILAMDVELDKVIEIVEGNVFSKYGFSMIIDQNNSFLNHYLAEDLQLIKPSLLTQYVNEDFVEEITFQDKKGALSTVKIDETPYRIMVFLENVEYRRHVTMLTTTFIILVISFIFLIGGLIRLNNRQILKPLVALEKDINSYDFKDLSYRLPKSENIAFNEIRSATNELLERNQKYYEENKKMHNDLIIENQRFNKVIGSTVDIIFEIDKRRRYVSAYGKGLEKIFKTSKDFEGKTAREVFGREGFSRDTVYKRALLGETIVYEWNYVTNNKSSYFESSISPIYDEKRRVVGAVGIARDVTDAKIRQDEIEYLSIHDYLTKLKNRRYFQLKSVEMDIGRNYPLGIVMIDLNGLKIFNDAYGHEAGDKALVEVAKGLTKVFTKEHVVSRIGGDEFAVIVPKANTRLLENYKESLKNILQNVYVENLNISIAFGYEIKTGKTTIEETLKRAENHMYRRKLAEGRSARNQAIRAIHKTLTEKYKEERIHSEKVSELCVALGTELGIKDESLKELELAALYHDIGKIAIPDAILNKPDKLTEEEFSIIKTHTEAGYQILRAADQYSNLAEYALTHHERFDGKGYPKGISGKDIPLFSRIISVVDAYEAMTSDRIYRKRLSEDAAIKEIIKHSGAQFDPDIAKIFVEKVLNKEWQEV